jgi:hypothetical protein
VCAQSGSDRREGRGATQDTSERGRGSDGGVQDSKGDYTGNTGAICGGTSASGAGKYVRRHGEARQEIGAKGVASGASKQRCWWGRQEWRWEWERLGLSNSDAMPLGASTSFGGRGRDQARPEARD